MTVRSGDTFESRGRQRAAFRVTDAESEGGVLRIELTAAPGSRVIRHRRLLQRERFEVIKGRVRWRVPRARRVNRGGRRTHSRSSGAGAPKAGVM